MVEKTAAKEESTSTAKNANAKLILELGVELGVGRRAEELGGRRIL
jgi:hypothetical protein